ncbi:pantoate--beta-alanine ligase [Actinosynnema sp. ALI-1.44]|uniref:pantoate--beta-alanine ligase n=1 Tax=Actinosynnema sp. ALI-1.44 TaxID=1933779 RepID=UPI00097C0F39|nr:pantoate--beta-alanine ligase [Actinosynnema sp. ALI-1.44]ONI78848.1 pantoate--beta-alanine ligase [Actinosynnema sp. ALI-1.44]
MTTPKAPEFTRGALHVHSKPQEVARITRALRAAGTKIVLVPTMGALHAGHRELIRRARNIPNTVVVVSIFVNPLQFGPNEDLDKYPRRLEADLDACRDERVEIVFTPEREDMYPPGSQVTVHSGPLGDELDGSVRKGHFDGVLTVVNKLFNIVRPDFALFGEKDYQQLVLIKRMVADLDMDTHVIGVPTVREPDGLALSSRNVYLDAAERKSAVALSAALSAGAFAGRSGGQEVVRAAREVLAEHPEVVVDYLELRAPDLGPAPEQGEARLLVAARVGTTRLIDNTGLRLGEPPEPGL